MKQNSSEFPKEKGGKKMKSCFDTYSLSSLLGSSNFLSVSFDSLSLLDLGFWSRNTVGKWEEKEDEKSYVSTRFKIIQCFSPCA